MSAREQELIETSRGSAADPLDALARAAAALELPSPDERRDVLREEAAALVDGLLVRVARGRGALDVAIGEGLAAMAEGERAIRLGFSGIGDYARERLGIAARTAQELARVARELRSRPLLAAAVRSGLVSARKAAVVLPGARGADEAGWVARARVETVRALEGAVRRARGAGDEDDGWERLVVPLAPEERVKVDEALALAGRLLGATAPRWERVEAICWEFLTEHPVEPVTGEPTGDVEDAWGADEAADVAGELGAVRRGPVGEWLAAAKIALEEETARWAHLDDPGAVAAPPLPEGPAAADLDAALRRLVALRERWDAVMGHLALIVRTLGLWRELGFASLGHYAGERLGMSARALEQRTALEARLLALPALREALAGGRITYEKARLVARRAEGADAAEVEALLARAEASTCVALRRELEADDDAQMCARGKLVVLAPAGVAEVLVAALRAAREAAEAFLSPGECLVGVAEHFLETWRRAIPRVRTVAQRVIERDGGLCQVPGCSRAAADAHHVRFRSRGGADLPENLIALCKVHHLRGVHAGYLQVTGEAPAGVSWELGRRG